MSKHEQIVILHPCPPPPQVNASVCTVSVNADSCPRSVQSRIKPWPLCWPRSAT